MVFTKMRKLFIYFPCLFIESVWTMLTTAQTTMASFKVIFFCEYKKTFFA